jgi:hypothetical protein
MAEDVPCSKRTHEYELGHTDRELKRLGTLARLVDPMTRQFFQNAGLAAGMRVLDIGSGAGDVAFLVAEFVGAGGEVVGTDRSETALASARRRAHERSLNNVSFRDGDPTEVTFDRLFDAVVGRYVLMFSPDPVAMLRGIARHLRPGGPPAPTYDLCCDWIVRTFRKVGTSTQMGLSLHSAFLRADLNAPTMGVQALVGGGSNSLSGLDLIADLAVTMGPVLEEMGVATIADLAPATLYERVRAEVEANGSVVIGRYEVGAWTRLQLRG